MLGAFEQAEHWQTAFPTLEAFVWPLRLVIRVSPAASQTGVAPSLLKLSCASPLDLPHGHKIPIPPHPRHSTV